MIFSMIVNTSLLFLAVSGILLIVHSKKKEHYFRRYEFLRSRLRMGKKKIFGKGDQDNLFEGTAFFVSRERYLMVWCLVAASFLLTGIVSGMKTLITAALLILVLGIPLEKAWGFQLPIGKLLQSLRVLFIRQKEAEIYETMTKLRNMAIMKKDRPVAADHMLEEMLVSVRYMKPHYLKMVHLMRLNKQEEALESFIAGANVPLAASFGRLLIKMDEINPVQMEEMIGLHQKAIREARITADKQRDEMISDLIYIPVVFNVLLIFINFILVVYFIQQKEFLSAFIR